MKSIVLGLGLMVLVSGIAAIVMGSQETSSDNAFVSTNNTVRLD